MIEKWTPKLKKEQCREGLTLRMWTDKDGEYYLVADIDPQIAALKAENQGLHDVCPAEMNSVANAALEGISKLKAERDRALTELAEERAALREALSLLVDFVPAGWEMPLGYGQAVAQAKDILKTTAVYAAEG